jgi:hypothetical protein
MKGNEGDRMAIEEDQNEVFWSLLVDLYTERLALKRSLTILRVTNPSIPILGISQLQRHVIYENNKTSATSALSGNPLRLIVHD